MNHYITPCYYTLPDKLFPLAQNFGPHPLREIWRVEMANSEKTLPDP